MLRGKNVNDGEDGGGRERSEGGVVHFLSCQVSPLNSKRSISFLVINRAIFLLSQHK